MGSRFTANQAFHALGLLTTSPVEVVKGRWQALASIHHPDRGGDADTFHTLRQAYEVAVEAAKEPLVCLSCDGTGKVTVWQGWSRVRLNCSECRGTGAKERI